MRKIGVLLVGLSLLTLSVIMVLSEVTKAIYHTAQSYGYDSISNFVYVLIAIVFLIGLISIFIKKQE
ncbi:hypothetical protein [Bacillus sp. FJAT-27245]|uniref:hypothetical protein n=1 Tax=Bacillus sp. FJAT-27245 TaxID=1684144 RepID=UPI0006A7E672|nr:hypothetical protein [Bacillus sp. FJAT-27245]